MLKLFSMKNLLILFLITISFCCQAQTTLNELKAKWKETSRVNSNGKLVDFRDTIRLEIMNSGYAMLRYDEGPTWVGDATLQKNFLEIKDQKFEVEKQTNNALHLNKNGMVHRLENVNQFGDNPIAKVIPQAASGDVKLDFETLRGKWTCYRKTDPAFDKGKMYIKQLEINSQIINQFAGSLTLHNMDTIVYENVMIELGTATLLVKGEKEIRNLRIIKSDGEELIAEDSKITYFLKRFGKKNTLLD